MGLAKRATADNAAEEHFIEKFASGKDDVFGLIAYAHFKWDKKAEKDGLKRQQVPDEEIKKRIANWCVTHSDGHYLTTYINEAVIAQQKFLLVYKDELEAESKGTKFSQFFKTLGTAATMALLVPLFWLSIAWGMQQSGILERGKTFFGQFMPAQAAPQTTDPANPASN